VRQQPGARRGVRNRARIRLDLERAGLGQANKLAGQFYFVDFTVFKVMFSAILTAALAAFCLDRLGLLDLSRVYVPETYVLPQIAGGLIFGVGFVAAGLCPGTSCVAAASGRLDGVAVMLGMFAGVLIVGLASSRWRPFTRARRGERLPCRTLSRSQTASYSLR
jgi:uncharacterized membrane protein YedE/YeeE